MPCVMHPILEVYVCPTYDTAPLGPLLTLERDSHGVWWHVVGAVAVRPAEGLETLLPLAPPRVWRSLMTRDTKP